MELVLPFLAGAFLTNGIPHFVSGLIGNKHMTPLGKDSSAITNVIWGFINIILGVCFLEASGGNFNGLLAFDSFAISFWLGSLVMALGCAWLFGNPNARLPWFK
jgi:hypothetical protein